MVDHKGHKQGHADIVNGDPHRPFGRMGLVVGRGHCYYTGDVEGDGEDEGQRLRRGNVGNQDLSQISRLPRRTHGGSKDSAGAGVQEEVVTYEEARQQLADDMKAYNNKVAVSCGIGQFLCNIWIWSFKKDMNKKIDAFEQTWGDTQYVTSDTQGNIIDDARKLTQKIFVRGSSSISFIGVIVSMWSSEYGKEGEHVWGVSEKEKEL